MTNIAHCEDCGHCHPLMSDHPDLWGKILNRRYVLECSQCKGAIIVGDECWIRRNTAVCVACSDWKHGEGVLPTDLRLARVLDHYKNSGMSPVDILEKALKERLATDAKVSDCHGTIIKSVYSYLPTPECDTCKRPCIPTTPPKAEEMVQDFGTFVDGEDNSGTPGVLIGRYPITKAEGSTASQDQTVKESLTVQPDTPQECEHEWEHCDDGEGVLPADLLLARVLDRYKNSGMNPIGILEKALEKTHRCQCAERQGGRWVPIPSIQVGDQLGPDFVSAPIGVLFDCKIIVCAADAGSFAAVAREIEILVPKFLPIRKSTMLIIKTPCCNAPRYFDNAIMLHRCTKCDGAEPWTPAPPLAGEVGSVRPVDIDSMPTENIQSPLAQTPKAEGVGEWETFEKEAISIFNDNSAETGVKWYVLPSGIKDAFLQAITSAVRAAEERKDGEWRDKMEAVAMTCQQGGDSRAALAIRNALNQSKE